MDSDDTDDLDLRKAISASLRDTHGSEDSPTSVSEQPKQDVVDLTAESDDELAQTFPKSNSVVTSDTEQGDDDDTDLKRAIELSMQSSRYEVDLTEAPDSPEKGLKNSLPEPVSEPVSNCPSVESKQAPASMGILGLDRKQMEEERIARLAKRKAQDHSLDESGSKHMKISTSPQRKFYNEIAAMSGRPSSPSTRHTPGGKATEQRVPSNQPGIQFPEGIIKKTWAFGCPRVGDDIRIEEVFQQSDLELAILSSFMWDTDWLFSKLNIAKTRFLLIMQAKDEHTKREYESDTAHMPNLRLCFPPMDGQINSMHSKLMLLFHPGYVRIVVPTANLLPFDWGEQGGFMENSVFLIDLPKKTDQVPTETRKTPFYDELVHFLGASTLHESIIAKLDHFDFSKTAHLAFVHTIGGSHVNDAWKRTGYCGLGRAVSSLELRSSGPLTLDFVTSSIGSLTNEFLRSIYLAAQGDDGFTEYVLRTAKSFPAKNPTNPNQLIDKTTAAEWTHRFRAYFPSEPTVRDSKGGPRNAGTICFQKKWFDGEKFPRHVLRDCRSRRPTLLMHNKIMYVRPDEPIPMSDDSRCRAWAYVGSANLSESAWGRLVQDRTTKRPKLNCRNWECGVLVPVIGQGEEKDPPGESVKNARVADENNSGELAESLDVFEGTVPVPMQVPGRRFEAGLKPWYFTF